MADGHLDDAERLLEKNLAGVEDVLETYGPAIIREGKLPELVELVEAASPSGRWAVARWIERGDLTNGAVSPDAGSGEPLAGVDLVSLADILADPDAYKPPEAVCYGLAYRGQTTILYAPPKLGKTSTALAAAAAVSAGERWMHHPTPQGPVLYLAAEGARGQLARHLEQFGADPDTVDLVVPGVEPLAELRTLVQFRDYRLVVIDTLGKWMSPLDVDRWKQSDVDTVLTPLERTIREAGAALVAIHHANAEGRPIDSTGFEAWADVLRRIEQGEDERERVVTDRARFEVPDLRFRLTEQEDGKRLTPSDPDREVKQKILDFVQANDGASTRAIREGVNARNPVIDDALEELRGARITVERDGAAMRHRISR